jgi:hypothetical protein
MIKTRLKGGFFCLKNRHFIPVDQNSPFCYNSHIKSKKAHMKYTLITSNGKVLTFFIKTVAEQFQQAYGGVVFSQQVLETAETVAQ